MTRNPEANCGHCWYFAKNDGPNPMYNKIGHCRAHPPIIFSENIDVSLFPVVSIDDWCGEWKTNYEG